MMFNNDTYERADELNKIVTLLEQQTEPEQMIIIKEMTLEQFEEYASELTKTISELEGSMGTMAIIGGELAPIFAEAAESFLEAKREFENEIRESWIIILNRFMPESWARFVVSKVPSQILWRFST